MFAEERPSPKKIFTPDGKYEFVEDGALGTGACGVVRIAKHLETGELYAIKIMSVTGRLSEFVKEMTAYGKVTGHPNVVTLHESQVDLDKKRVYLIMELCRGGELFDRIAETGKMEEVVARRYFAHMVSAMDHCHARSVFHRDLKPENILLGGTSLDEIKVADFGLAALLSQVDHGDGGHFLNHTKCGSIMYAAPELLLSTERVGYDSATADIWSLGVILYSMLAGALPFKVALAARCPRFAWVEQHGLCPICAHLGLSPEASEVLQAMLRPVSSERPSLAQILECAWLQPIAHELPQRQAPGTPSRRAAAAPPTPKAAAAPGMFGKWCEEITLCPMEVEAAASGGGGGGGGGGGSGGGESSKRPVEHSCPAAEAAEQAAKRVRGADPGARPEVEEPEGVNGMLVRSLGWVQLPSDK